MTVKNTVQELIENSKAMGFAIARLALVELEGQVLELLRKENIAQDTYGVIYARGVVDTFRNVKTAFDKKELEL